MTVWSPLAAIPESRPYVILNAAMSLDGKISTRGHDSCFSDEEDWRFVYSIRANVDGIMVGVNTIIVDNPSLRVKIQIPSQYPARIVVDSRGRTPLDASVLRAEIKRYPTIICGTESMSFERRLSLEGTGAKIMIINEGPRVNVVQLMQRLLQQGFRRILLEGGSTLNWSMIDAGLVDEIRLFIAPVVAGGSTAVSLVGGDGVVNLTESKRFKFAKFEQRGDYIILRYIRTPT